MGLFRIQRNNSFLRLLPLIMALCFSVAACGGSSSGDGNNVESTTIGVNGGVAEDANGAKVEIPKGALSARYDISIASFLTGETLPRKCSPLPVMRGAVELEPEGLTFSTPVTVRVPVSVQMEPGSRFPLLYWNGSAQIWEQTAFTAKVADDGMSFSADITHFSVYGGGAVEDLIFGGTADQFMNDFSAWFYNNVKKENDISEKDNECFRVTGLDFDLEYDINGSKGSKFHRIGEPSDFPDSPLIMVDYTYDAAKGHNFSGYVRMTVVVYYDCTKPNFILMAEKSVLNEGGSTRVEARLKCAGVALTGREMTFDIKSGPGEISPGRATTNISGMAFATFTAGDAGAVVRAIYNGCAFGESYTLERTAPIAVAAGQYALDISFYQTMQLENILDSFSYGGIVPIRVTGTDSVSGTAHVEGSATFDVNGGGAAGDCSTITEGTVTFTFTGTLVTDDQGKQTLNLTQTPDFLTTKTTYCPEQPAVVNAFLTGGEMSEFSIPAEDGHSWEETKTFTGGSSHIFYVLNVLK